LVCGGLAALLLAGLAVNAATAADDDDDDAPKKPAGIRLGYTGRFGKPRPPAEPKKPEPKQAVSSPAPPPDPARRDREFNAYLRRSAACDRLMEIAVDTNNEAMQRQVEELSVRVWAVYQQN